MGNLFKLERALKIVKLREKKLTWGQIGIKVKIDRNNARRTYLRIKMVSGIYKITNLINNKIYIGSSISIKVRIYNHQKELTRNKHFNFHLQSAWNKYGQENFKFEIIEIIENANKEKLLEREQFWIDETKCFNQTIGYNKRLEASSNLGMKFDPTTLTFFKGKKHTEETKAKMSAGKKGIPKTEEVKRNMAKASGMRNKEKWPHEKGSLCRCSDCIAKRTKASKLRKIKHKLKKQALRTQNAA